MTQKQIELQNELRERLAQFGIEVLNLRTKELNTLKMFFDEIDKSLEEQNRLVLQMKSVAINATNIARNGGISKSTIDHSETMKSIIKYYQSLENKEEEFVSQKKYDNVVAELEISNKKLNESKKTELDLFKAKQKIEELNRKTQMLEDNIKTLYNDIATIKEKDDYFKEKMDQYFPNIKRTINS